MKKTLIFAASCAAFAAFAGVPIKWSVETSRAEERVIEVYHGESLDMEVTFKTYGQILELPTNEVAATFWQTNGMNTAYWRTNNVEVIASNGVMRTTFGPEQDVGAKTLRGFIGIPGQIYRAAFVLRFKDAPGYNVAIVEWPYRLLDFKAIEVVNPPYDTSESVAERFAKVYADLKDPTNYVSRVFESTNSYLRGEVIVYNGKMYRAKQNVDAPQWSTPDEGIFWEEVTALDEVMGGALYGDYLRLGNNGFNGKQEFMARIGTATDGGVSYLHGFDGGIGVYNTKDDTRGAYLLPDGVLRIMRGGAIYNQYDLNSMLYKTSIVPMTYGYIHSENEVLVTSPRYVYEYLTNNYWTASESDVRYLKKSDAEADYLTKQGASEKYAAKTNVYTKSEAEAVTEAAIEGAKITKLYGEGLRNAIDGAGGVWKKSEDVEAFSNATGQVFMPVSGESKTWGYLDGEDEYRLLNINFHWILRKNGSNIANGPGNGSEETPWVNDGANTIYFYRFAIEGNWSKVDEVATKEWTQEKISESTPQVGEETLVLTNGNVETKGGTAISAANVGAYPATSGATLEGSVSTMGAQLNTVGSTLNAEDAKFEITNYNSVVHMPEASFSVKVQNESTGSNEWIVAWREMTRWSWFLGMFGTFTNDLNTVLGNKSEKEYAFYDGVTGNPAPDGFFWISQPRVAICAGMAYQRYADAGGEVWVLESNGMVADINGTTNGFFRITDSENEVQFEIIKGNKRTLAAAPRTMTSQVMGITHYFTSYATTNAVSNPVARFSRDLKSGSWIDETDLDCPCNTSWTDKGGGIYECEWWPKSTEPRMFMSAVYETGGSTRIVQHAPVEMQKIIIGGVEYTIGTATISGQTVLTLTATP